MKLVTDPFKFTTGDVLDPHDINQVWRYASEGIADTAQRRYKEVVFPLSFTKSVSSGYAHTDNADLRRFRFEMPVAGFVTRAFLTGNITSSADVEVEIVRVSTGLPPAGCPDPWLRIDSTGGVAADVSDFGPVRFPLLTNRSSTRFPSTSEASRRSTLASASPEVRSQTVAPSASSRPTATRSVA